jgi:hypothetical protein
MRLIIDNLRLIIDNLKNWEIPNLRDLLAEYSTYPARSSALFKPFFEKDIFSKKTDFILKKQLSPVLGDFIFGYLASMSQYYVACLSGQDQEMLKRNTPPTRAELEGILEPSKKYTWAPRFSHLDQKRGFKRKVLYGLTLLISKTIFWGHF